MSGFSPVTRVMSAAERALSLVQSEYPNYHPLISLARMAHDQRVIADPRLELEVHRSILPYVAPKLANVEVKQTDPDSRRIVVSLFENKQLEDGRVVEVEVPLVREASEIVPLD